MKTVFDNRQCAHVWAQQNQERGKSSNGNLWFENQTIYSYSTPIAKMHGDIALITSNTYSVTTTGKHMPTVHRAVRYDSSFTVPFIGQRGGKNYVDSANMIEVHAGNRAYFIDVYKKAFDSAKRSKSNFIFHGERLFGIAKEYARYCEAFNLENEWPEFTGETFPTYNAEIDRNSINQTWETKLAKFNDPEAFAKREKERVRRKERQQEKHDRKRAEVLADWLAGKTGRILCGYEPDKIHMRIEGDDILTTQGARFPIEDAKRTFQAVRVARESNSEYISSSNATKQAKLGHFKIDKIDAQGNVTAGCHYVEWDQIERIARELKIYP